LDDAEGVDTLGGYIVKRLARWPRPGDSIDLGEGYRAKVTSVVQKRRVGQVVISPKPVEKTEPAANA
jgi:CBS domain containing-hemolysin-like protein